MTMLDKNDPRFNPGYQGNGRHVKTGWYVTDYNSGARAADMPTRMAMAWRMRYTGKHRKDNNEDR